jgi:hypothetical protein
MFVRRARGLVENLLTNPGSGSASLNATISNVDDADSIGVQCITSVTR